MHTKVQQILSPHSAWNQAPNDEPVLVLRASDWQEVLFMAVRGKFNKELHEQAMKMKAYSNENDIPF
jgi:hypothetical protein